ncbi:putative 65-kDa microtubule-associated protein 1-like [Capsicum annuum]|nr:putative 65-kDa microtubule-associated protein 1-like [Capsicum annuum]
MALSMCRCRKSSSTLLEIIINVADNHHRRRRKSSAQTSYHLRIVDLKEKKKETPDDEAKSRKLNHAITSSTSNDNILTRQSISDIFDEDFEELRTNQPTHAESDVNYDLYLKGCD